MDARAGIVRFFSDEADDVPEGDEDAVVAVRERDVGKVLRCAEQVCRFRNAVFRDPGFVEKVINNDSERDSRVGTIEGALGVGTSESVSQSRSIRASHSMLIRPPQVFRRGVTDDSLAGWWHHAHALQLAQLLWQH